MRAPAARRATPVRGRPHADPTPPHPPARCASYGRPRLRSPRAGAHLASWHSIRPRSTTCSRRSRTRPAGGDRRARAGPGSVGDLAESASMTLPSFMKHVHMLERCGLIRTAKAGRVRTCTLEPRAPRRRRRLARRAAGGLGGPHRPSRAVRHRPRGAVMTARSRPRPRSAASTASSAPPRPGVEGVDRPADLARWWLPAPTQCRVDRLDVVPGGAFVTSMSDDGIDVRPAPRRLLPRRRRRRADRVHQRARQPLAAGRARAGGDDRRDHVRRPSRGHRLPGRRAARRPGARARHEELGFADGWGTVTAQLADICEAARAR